MFDATVNNRDIAARTRGLVVLSLAIFAIGFASTGGCIDDDDVDNSTPAPSSSVSYALIKTDTLPGGIVGEGYSVMISVQGGSGTYAWAVEDQDPRLAGQLSLNTTTGAYTGTPTANGEYWVKISVTASGTFEPGSTTVLAKDIRTYAFSIVKAESLTIETVAVPNMEEDVAYTTTVVASGGISPRTFSVFAGALPTGLSLGTSTGVISGTVATAGTFDFTLRVTDGAATTFDRQFRGRVLGSGASTAIVAVTDFTGTQTGDIPIQFTIEDPGTPGGVGDFGNASVSVEFTTDNGSSWKAATQVAGPSQTLGLHPDAFGAPVTTRTFNWDTIADLGMGQWSSVRVRVTPFTPVAGSSDQTAKFAISNLEFRKPATPTHVIGQPDFNSAFGAAGAGGVKKPSSVASGLDTANTDTFVLVADAGNHRVPVYRNPVSTGTIPAGNAVMYLGQTGSAGPPAVAPESGSQANMGGSASASTLNGPRGVAVINDWGGAANDFFAVADTLNNRVLLYPMPTGTISSTAGIAATIALGQSSLTATASNKGGASPTSSSLSRPEGVFFDGTRLIVSDTGNNRILIWNTLPATGDSAAVLLGQPSSSVMTPGDTASKMDRPRGVWSSGGGTPTILVADTGNNRVLVFDDLSDAVADRVLGQSAFPDHKPNAGRPVPGANTLVAPSDVVFDSTDNSVYVADTGNNRVLVFQSALASITNGMSAQNVIGQSTSTGSLPGGGTQGLRSPLAFRKGTGNIAGFALADTDNNRVLVYAGSLSAFQPNAVQVTGQVGFTTATDATTAAGLSRPGQSCRFGTTLFLADTDNNRVLIYNNFGTSNGQAASLVLGQPDLASSDANTGGISGKTMSAPEGVWTDGTTLFVADTGNNRVLVWDTLPTSSFAAADRVIGQTTFTGSSTGLTASTLSGPRRITGLNGTMFIADSGNHRVLQFNSVIEVLNTNWPTSAIAANAVYGQPDLVTGAAGATSSLLSSPVGIAFDGSRLVVADSGNHRVQFWSSVDTAATGTAGAATGTLGTTGSAGATAAQLNAPLGVATDGVRIFVADTGNHRVVMWPSVGAAGATLVFGQPLLTSSTPNNGGLNAAGLVSPANVTLFGTRLLVSDAGNRRQVTYASQ